MSAGGRPTADDGLAVHFDHPTRALTELSIREVVQRAARGEGFAIAELDIVLSDHARVRELNRTWLGHDYETDVLSFPLDAEAISERFIDGEIYVDLDTAAERADEFESTFEHEALRYVVHGLLHLMGYDDATAEQWARMRAIEDQYLTTMD